MMDLKNFDTKAKANEGVEIELRDLRTGKGSGAFIRVLGTDSDKFAELSAERSRQVATILERTGKKELSREEVNGLTVDLLAGCTIGWRGLKDGGEPFEYSDERAKKLYEGYPAIREQVNLAIADRTNFLLA